MAKKSKVYMTVRFSGRDEEKVYAFNDQFSAEDIDELMQEGFEKGWITFLDDEDTDVYINLDSVDELYFE